MKQEAIFKDWEIMNILDKVEKRIGEDCENFYSHNPDADETRREQRNKELDGVYRARHAIWAARAEKLGLPEE